MKPRVVRSVLVLLITAVSGLVVIWLAIGRFAPVTAQEPGNLWGTSAEAPAGTPLEHFSAPDTPELPDGDVDPASPDTPDALISWRVVGSALKPRENDVSYTVSPSGGCVYVTAGDANSVWNFAPHLPQGAVVDTLRMYYNDTSGSNSTAWFTVYDLYGELVQEWSVSSSDNFGNSFNDSAQINHTIDYSLYSYLLNWRPVVTGSSMQLCGFRVFYTPPPFGAALLPAVIRTP